MLLKQPFYILIPVLIIIQVREYFFHKYILLFIQNPSKNNIYINLSYKKYIHKITGSHMFHLECRKRKSFLFSSLYKLQGGLFFTVQP